MDTFSSFLDPSLLEKGIRGGFELAVGTLFLTFVLEVISLRTSLAVWQQKNGRSLYLQAVAMNFVLHFLLGVPIYAIAVAFICRADDGGPVQWWRTVGVFTIHSVIYYQVHKTFHSSPSYYQYHRFHHRFKEHTPPVAANAVSIVEYLVAYILPVAVAGMAVRPTPFEARTAVAIMSLGNLLVHTPALEKVPGPPFWVLPADHMAHHRLVNVHFASPTWNVDWLVEKWKHSGGAKAEKTS